MEGINNKMKRKIAIGTSSFAQSSDNAINILKTRGYEIAKNPFGRKLTIEETIEHLKDAVGLLAGLEELNEDVFAACPCLKAVARVGIGVDNVDFEAAARHNIKVSNTPDAPTYAVAEMALSALLSIARNVIEANSDMHNGKWNKRTGFSIKGSTILIIGYGRIGRKFASFLQLFEPEILIYDPYVPENDGRTLEELLSLADVVSLHVIGNATLLKEKEFSCFKKGAVLLNSARGSLVEESALIAALKSGIISYYWADVFNGEPYQGELCKLDNAILTPHISTYTSLCRNEMETQAAENLLRDLSDG